MIALILVIMLILGMVALYGLFVIVGSVIGILLTLLMAGFVGWAADALVPGHVPFGFVGAILAGLFGSWLGVALFGRLGPYLFHIPVISAFLGALIISVAFSLLLPSLTQQR